MKTQMVRFHASWIAVATIVMAAQSVWWAFESRWRPPINHQQAAALSNSHMTNCADARVLLIHDLIRSSASQNISIFPRNGLLLGISRHGGFLPNENALDADLGALHSDLDKIRAVPTFSSLAWPNKRYTLDVSRFVRGSALVHSLWNGEHPLSHKTLREAGVVVQLEGERVSFANFFYSYNKTHLFYPIWASDQNAASQVAEVVRYNARGGKGVNLNSGIPMEDPTGMLQLGNVFPESCFDETVRLPFYDTYIDVPAGYEAINVAFYGVDWATPLTRQLHGNGEPTTETRQTAPPSRVCFGWHARRLPGLLLLSGLAASAGIGWAGGATRLQLASLVWFVAWWCVLGLVELKTFFFVPIDAEWKDGDDCRIAMVGCVGAFEGLFCALPGLVLLLNVCKMSVLEKQ